MLKRILTILVVFSSLTLLLSCANTKQTAQADSKSIIRQPESDHETHGEVGVMYGARASRH
jgi:hypothetical protein